jgi:hypothetical protein
VLCLIYPRSFDVVVAMYDSDWYIKRLNSIEIDTNALFWAVKSQFWDGADPAYMGASIGGPHIPAAPVLNS